MIKNFFLPLYRFLLRTAVSHRKLATALCREAQRCHPDLADFRIPLSHELVALLPGQNSAHSFGEIFLQNEYAQVKELLLPARRWLDIGCHCGYFSLWLEWERRKAAIDGMSVGLLLDADPLSVTHSRRLLAENVMGDRFEVLHGAISVTSGVVVFEQRPFMASSLRKFDQRPGRKLEVPVVSDETIVSLLAPPYDLVKVDIEGAEADFFQAYPKTLSGAQVLLVEWHSWNGFASDGDAVAARLLSEGFVRRITVRSPMPALESGPGECFGVELFLREKTV